MEKEEPIFMNCKHENEAAICTFPWTDMELPTLLNCLTLNDDPKLENCNTLMLPPILNCLLTDNADPKFMNLKIEQAEAILLNERKLILDPK
jgi:hypothetical protein